MRILCANLLVLGALLVPAAATAKTVPPGNSGADQYVETLPGAEGNHPTGSGGGGSGSSKDGGSSKDVLSVSAQRNLDQLGRVGQATADLAQSTVPQQTGGAPAKKGHGPSASADNASGSSGFTDVLKQAGGSGDSGGMGIALPLIMAGSLLAAFAYLWARRRSAGVPGETG